MDKNFSLTGILNTWPALLSRFVLPPGNIKWKSVQVFFSFKGEAVFLIFSERCRTTGNCDAAFPVRYNNVIRRALFTIISLGTWRTDELPCYNTSNVNPGLYDITGLNHCIKIIYSYILKRHQSILHLHNFRRTALQKKIQKSYN